MRDKVTNNAGRDMTAKELRKNKARVTHAVVFAVVLALLVGGGIYRALSYFPPPACYVIRPGLRKAPIHKAGHTKAGQHKAGIHKAGV
jgi:hypothetical protein